MASPRAGRASSKLRTSSDDAAKSRGSAGALSRALGPILGGVLFWKFSSEAPYLLASALLLAPLITIARLPEPPAEPEDLPESEGSAPAG